jgi:hypothetical protein
MTTSMYWALSTRKRKKDDFVLVDRYLDFEVAKEFAEEMVGHHGHYEAVIFNSKGMQVFQLVKTKRRRGHV